MLPCENATKGVVMKRIEPACLKITLIAFLIAGNWRLYAGNISITQACSDEVTEIISGYYQRRC